MELFKLFFWSRIKSINQNKDMSTSQFIFKKNKYSVKIMKDISK
jgi:predicted DNA-binding ribbon-helix-helix protein